jgi:hypothetical protein
MRLYRFELVPYANMIAFFDKSELVFLKMSAKRRFDRIVG